ncbi:MAG: hypothetical protein QF599_04130, partial [Planctomycetota bacterium]|nr:hypothetical protein [Planctomycetota bacterium]
MTEGMQKLPTYIYGAGGLLCGELLRLLPEHPHLLPVCAITRSGPTPAVRTISELHPHLALDLPLSNPEQGIEALAQDLELGEAVLFLGMPHGESAGTWRAIRERLGPLAERLWLVDLSADYRIRDAAAWEVAYGTPHGDSPGLAAFSYGLVEFARQALVGCRRIAAPGCFATALQLACLPLWRAGLLAPQGSWVLNAVTGSSGSGVKAKASTHHPHRNGNLCAYALDGHRHELELLQACASPGVTYSGVTDSRATGSKATTPPAVIFQPHSGPFVRGIYLTAVLPLAGTTRVDELRAEFHAAFEDAPFVSVRDSGAPELRHVLGSNRAELAVNLRADCALVLLAMDNTLKGGSGQALQALNIA